MKAILAPEFWEPVAKAYAREVELEIYALEGCVSIEYEEGVPDPEYLNGLIDEIRLRRLEVELIGLVSIDPSSCGFLEIRVPEVKRPQVEYEGQLTPEVIKRARCYPIVDILGHDKFIRCLSPDHEDRNPSMSINVRDNYAKCFSCGFHLDAIGVQMITTGDSFPEAVKKLQK